MNETSLSGEDPKRIEARPNSQAGADLKREGRGRWKEVKVQGVQIIVIPQSNKLVIKLETRERMRTEGGILTLQNRAGGKREAPHTS